MIAQLPLSLRWQDHATFANFYVGDNLQVVDYLRGITQGLGERFIYLYGAEGSGLTHLLQACCQAVNRQGKTAAYLPLANCGLVPEMLEGMESLDLLCLDDIQAIAGKSAWEEALFHSYNRLLTSQTRLVIVGHAALKQMPWILPDLLSRLSASVIFQLKTLSDEQKIIALQQRAKVRGLELSSEVGQYLLNRYPRDMHLLFNTLEKLDQASLAAQRRLTIPFVKLVLED